MSTTTYRIADYLPMAARRAATARAYGADRRCRDGKCPLGVALDALGLDDSRTPSADRVARRLASRVRAQQSELEAAAAAFIKDWDTGRVADLAAAWDVTPAPPDGTAPPAASPIAAARAVVRRIRKPKEG